MCGEISKCQKAQKKTFSKSAPKSLNVLKVKKRLYPHKTYFMQTSKIQIKKILKIYCKILFYMYNYSIFEQEVLQVSFVGDFIKVAI